MMRIVDTTLYRSQHPHMALNMAPRIEQCYPLKAGRSEYYCPLSRSAIYAYLS